jgi:hypothetical protein
MRQKDERKKKLIIAAVVAWLVIGGIAVVLAMPKKAPAIPPQPVPLGTNELRVGAKLYNRHAPTNQHLFTVIKVDPAYEFPDGETRPGVKVRSPSNGGSIWTPREKMNDFLVVQ